MASGYLSGRNRSNPREDGVGRPKKMITVETERVTVISRHGQRAVGWCEKCGEVVHLLSEAEVLERTQAQEQRLHGTTTPDGTLLVCPKSLGDEREPRTKDQGSGENE